MYLNADELFRLRTRVYLAAIIDRVLPKSFLPQNVGHQLLMRFRSEQESIGPISFHNEINACQMHSSSRGIDIRRDTRWRGVIRGRQRCR